MAVLPGTTTPPADPLAVADPKPIPVEVGWDHDEVAALLAIVNSATQTPALTDLRNLALNKLLEHNAASKAANEKWTQATADAHAKVAAERAAKSKALAAEEAKKEADAATKRKAAQEKATAQVGATPVESTRPLATGAAAHE